MLLAVMLVGESSATKCTDERALVGIGRNGEGVDILQSVTFWKFLIPLMLDEPD